MNHNIDNSAMPGMPSGDSRYEWREFMSFDCLFTECNPQRSHKMKMTSSFGPVSSRSYLEGRP